MEQKINHIPIYLASKSPRRKFLMEESGFKVTLLSIDVEEVYPDTLAKADVAQYVATLKATACQNLIHHDDIAITADTVVVHAGQVLEKPKDIEEARSMLRTISASKHTVYTGVCIIQNNTMDAFTVQSDVFVGEMTEHEIEYYIQHHKPFDKAGSYGIQEWFGWVKIERIEGSYSNIMGLPMYEVYNKISQRL